VAKLAETVYAYQMIRPPLPTCEVFTTNSQIVVSSDGVLVADGQGSVADTARMVEEIKKITSQPIKYVVMGSEHGDHASGNPAFPPSAILISHPLAKANIERQAGAPNRPANAPALRVPADVVADKREIRMGTTDVHILNIGRAHTGSDLVVYLPRERVLFMSEVYSQRLFPAARSGYLSEWINAIKKAESMDAAYYVPAHGFVDDADTMKAELAEYRRALEKIVAEAKRLHKPGATPEQIAEAFKSADLTPYTTWMSYGPMGQASFQRAWEEIDGKVK
jgi:glyoxylase-like metal-dependent hydrolase (beta-lactamase superfamily II)